MPRSLVGGSMSTLIGRLSPPPGHGRAPSSARCGSRPPRRSRRPARRGPSASGWCLDPAEAVPTDASPGVSRLADRATLGTPFFDRRFRSRDGRRTGPMGSIAPEVGRFWRPIRRTVVLAVPRGWHRLEGGSERMGCTSATRGRGELGGRLASRGHPSRAAATPSRAAVTPRAPRSPLASRGHPSRAAAHPSRAAAIPLTLGRNVSILRTMAHAVAPACLAGTGRDANGARPSPDDPRRRRGRIGLDQHRQLRAEWLAAHRDRNPRTRPGRRRAPRI